MTEARIELNFLPPQDNHRLVRLRSGRVFLSPRSREFYEQFVSLCRRLKVPLIPGWVVVEMSVQFPDRRRRDSGNLIKSTMDGLVKAGVIEDDCFALPQIVSVKVVHGEEGFTIRVRPATGDEAPA